MWCYRHPIPSECSDRGTSDDPRAGQNANLRHILCRVSMYVHTYMHTSALMESRQGSAARIPTYPRTGASEPRQEVKDQNQGRDPRTKYRKYYMRGYGLPKRSTQLPFAFFSSSRPPFKIAPVNRPVIYLLSHCVGPRHEG